MRLFAQDLTTDTLQHIAARGLSEAGGPKPLLLRVLVDLFVRRPSHSDDEIQHFAEIAHSILPCATRAEIDHAAERLCMHPAAPGELVDLLASRGGEGALLLLAKCRRLSTSVLQNAAVAGPPEAACAVAGRDDLDAATIDLLAARPESAISLALVENKCAPLPAPLLTQLVNRARHDTPLARALCRRMPHRAETLGLFLQASRSDRLLMMTAARMRADEENGLLQEPEHDEQTNLGKLVTASASTPASFADLLAQALGCAPDMAERITQDRGGEPLLVVLRALGADAALVTEIMRKVAGDLTEGQAAWREALAASLSRHTACMILHAVLETGMTGMDHLPLHDQSMHGSSMACAPLTTFAEQKLQQSLSA